MVSPADWELKWSTWACHAGSQPRGRYGEPLTLLGASLLSGSREISSDQRLLSNGFHNHTGSSRTFLLSYKSDNPELGQTEISSPTRRTHYQLRPFSPSRCYVQPRRGRWMGRSLWGGYGFGARGWTKGGRKVGRGISGFSSWISRGISKRKNKNRRIYLLQRRV